MGESAHACCASAAEVGFGPGNEGERGERSGLRELPAGPAGRIGREGKTGKGIPFSFSKTNFQKCFQLNFESFSVLVKITQYKNSNAPA